MLISMDNFVCNIHVYILHHKSSMRLTFNTTIPDFENCSFGNEYGNKGTIYIGSYKSAHFLLNLLNELGMR